MLPAVLFRDFCLSRFFTSPSEPVSTLWRQMRAVRQEVHGHWLHLTTLTTKLRNCFDFFVKWIEMYFRGVSGCYLSKFSGLNVENNNRKRPERRSGTLTKSHAVSP